LKYTINVLQVHWNTLKYTINTFIYFQILWKTLKYTIKIQYIDLNKFKYTQILSNTLKYIEMYYKCIELNWNTLSIWWSTLTQMHWKKIQILWCLFKYIYLSLKIHCYVLIYIRIPSKYIVVIKTLHTFDIYYNTITILQYTSIYVHIRWNCLKTSLFHIFSSCYYTNFSKLSWRLIIPPRCRWHAMKFLLE
jgi:hypothetical protein